MRVSLETLKDRAGWEKTGVRLPAFDVQAMRDLLNANGGRDIDIIAKIE